MQKYLAHTLVIVFGGTLIFAVHTTAFANTQDADTQYCSDYSVDRLVNDNSADEMDLRDQYALIDRYYADCMTEKKTEARKEATTYVIQPAFFN